MSYDGRVTGIQIKWEAREEKLLLCGTGSKPLKALEEPPGGLRAIAKEFHPTEPLQTASSSGGRPAVDKMEPMLPHSVDVGDETSLKEDEETSGEARSRRPDPSGPPIVTPSQLPPICKGDEVESFSEWVEQFILVADVCRWNEQTKLVNLVMRLKGPAYSFYHTCSAAQRANYQSITKELEKRFTPVRIPVVESNLFHERKQAANESVDQYAQCLRELFYKAYPRTQQCTKKAEDMGQSVLTCQFIAGLRKEIKGKVVGTERNFDALLTKARFEEAKEKEFVGSTKPVSSTSQRPVPTTQGDKRSSGQAL